MSIGVVHLVRRGNAPSLFEAFLNSYSGREAGVSHDLIIALKGYETEDPHELRHLLNHVRSRQIVIPGDGFDIQSYLYLAKFLNHQHVCFLNSHSELLADEWLLKLYSTLRKQGVGLVGATGSWQGLFRHFQGNKPDLSPIRSNRPAWKAAVIRAFPFLAGAQSRISGQILQKVFPPFPN